MQLTLSFRLFALGAACSLLAPVSSAHTAKGLSHASSDIRPFSRPGMNQWTMTSREGRHYLISISLPQAAAPVDGYPAIFVLDGESSFSTVADAARNQEILYGPVVVVGIGYPNDEEAAHRTIDLSLVADLEDAFRARRSAIRNEGADAFLSFILDEVKPAVASITKVDTSREALFGHSLGGLMAIHTLLTRPEAFDTYVAGSPSVWAGGAMLRSELKAFETSPPSRWVGRSAYIMVGALEDRLNPEEARAAKAMDIRFTPAMVAQMAMVEDAHHVAQRLREAGVDVRFCEFPGETHASVVPAYLGRGVRYVLGRWFD